MGFRRGWPWIVLFLGAALAGCGRSSVKPATPAKPVLQPSSDATNPAGSSSAPAGESEATASAEANRPDDWFEDATLESGIRFAYRNGREAGRFYILESLGGGAAMIDYDLDGVLDLFFTGGGTISTGGPVSIAGLPSALYRNEGQRQFGDVTNLCGFEAPPDFSHGCAVTDYDADGFPDLFVCCYGRSRLYRNLGDGSFAEAGDEARLPALGWHTGAAFADLDRDGLPDLFVSRYTDWSPEADQVCIDQHGVQDVCGPGSYPGTTCQFFHNAGDGAFDDWSQRVGLAGNIRGLGVVAADFNADGWVDFYVASDESPKHLYLGGPELRFTEDAVAAGVAVSENGRAEGSMGVDVGDYNGDGLLDILVTNFENEDNALYRNLGDGLFMHSTIASGLGGVSRMRVGWGTAMTDFDGDGWLDLFVLNGNPLYHTGLSPFKQAPQLFRNRQGKRFEEVSPQGGVFFRQAHAGRGLAVGDLDNDGAPDIVTVQVNDPVRILYNRLAPKNFVRVQLAARHGEREATGARLTIEYDRRRLVRFVVQGAGYLSRFDPRLIFPVDESASTAEVAVDWPGRATETFRGLAVRQTHLLIEGRGDTQHVAP